MKNTLTHCAYLVTQYHNGLVPRLGVPKQLGTAPTSLPCSIPNVARVAISGPYP